MNEKASAYIASLPSPQRDICEALRQLILGADSRITEQFKWNYPAYYYGGRRICSTGGFKAHANLEFDYGAHLLDQKGRIEGVGKNIRHIKIRDTNDLDNDYFTDLVRQSVKLVTEQSKARSPTSGSSGVLQKNED